MARTDGITSRHSSPETAADGPSLSFYIPNLIVGGAEQVTINIVNGLFRRGYDVELVLSHPYGKLKSEIDSGVPVVTLGESRVPVAGIVAHIPRLVAYLEENRPDALISQVTHANVVCLMAGRLASTETKIIPTEHNAFDVEPPESIKSRMLRQLAVRVLPTADELIAVSQGVADSIVTKTAVKTDDVHVLHNPIDIETVREQAADPVNHDWIENDELDVVLFVGRLHPQKDLET
jgi:glycosyltransferase involved in cell wall biosynthesis